MTIGGSGPMYLRTIRQEGLLGFRLCGPAERVDHNQHLMIAKFHIGFRHPGYYEQSTPDVLILSSNYSS